MKKKSIILAVIIVAVFASAAFAAVPHYWSTFTGGDDHSVSTATGANHQKVANCEYERSHGGGQNCDD